MCTDLREPLSVGREGVWVCTDLSEPLSVGREGVRCVLT